MTLRSTRQYTEVLVAGEGTLRSSRQYIEVLVRAPILESVIDTLSFTDSNIIDTTQGPLPRQNVSDTLIFVDEAGWYKGNLEPYDTVSFSDTNTVTLNRYSVSDDITFTEQVILSETFDLSLTQTITFTQTIANKTNIYSLVQTLAFVQEIDYFEITKDLLDIIEFTEVIDFEYGGLYGFVQDQLILTQTITIWASEYYTISQDIEFTEENSIFSPYNITITTDMLWEYGPDGFPYHFRGESFQQTIDRELVAERDPYVNMALEQTISMVIERASATSLSITDELILIDIAAVVDGIVDTIVFSESITIDICYAVFDSITLSDSYIKSLDHQKSSSNELILKSTFTYDLLRQNYTHIYHPFIGETDEDAPMPIPEDKESYTLYDNVLLFYPVDTPTTNIYLNGPELGDIDRLNITRINRESLGGTLIVYSDPIWPSNRNLVLTFIGLSETIANNVKTLIDESIGQLVGLRDWYGRVWHGIIVSVDTPFTENNYCNYSVSLEMECIRISEPESSDILALEETIGLTVE